MAETVEKSTKLESSYHERRALWNLLVSRLAKVGDIQTPIDFDNSYDLNVDEKTSNNSGTRKAEATLNNSGIRKAGAKLMRFFMSIASQLIKSFLSYFN